MSRARAAGVVAWRTSPAVRTWLRGPAVRAGPGAPKTRRGTRRGRRAGMRSRSGPSVVGQGGGGDDRLGGATCDLDLVVIGGGVARGTCAVPDPLRAALREYLGLDFITGLRVVPAELGGGGRPYRRRGSAALRCLTFSRFWLIELRGVTLSQFHRRPSVTE